MVQERTSQYVTKPFKKLTQSMRKKTSHGGLKRTRTSDLTLIRGTL